MEQRLLPRPVPVYNVNVIDNNHRIVLGVFQYRLGRVMQ
jgi:hypothetical protein